MEIVDNSQFDSDSTNQAEIAKLLPPEEALYFEDIEKKHFDPDIAVGSFFTDARTLRGLLELAQSQRGNLSGDDRNTLVKEGVNPGALDPSCRYLVVQTPGRLGIANAEAFSDDIPVHVLETKRNAPFTLAVDIESRDQLPQTSTATIIIGPNLKQDDDSPERTTEEMIWTVHPGLPIKPSKTNLWPSPTTVLLKEVREKFVTDRPGEPVIVNLRLRPTTEA